MAIAIEYIDSFFGKFKIISRPIILLFCCYWSLDFSKIEAYTADPNYRKSKALNTNIYKKLDQIVPANVQLVMNVNELEHIDAMFYSRFICYNYCCTEKEFKNIAEQNIPIAVFAERQGYALPAYIKEYKHLFIIQESLR